MSDALLSQLDGARGHGGELSPYVVNGLLDDSFREIEQLRAKLAESLDKSDAEMLRVKACEHIAEGDDGWERLTNICPSTAAVGLLRAQLSDRNAPQADARRLDWLWRYIVLLPRDGILHRIDLLFADVADEEFVCPYDCREAHCEHEPTGQVPHRERIDAAIAVTTGG